MPIKDDNYYLNFDLESAAKEIHALGSERGKNEVFGDALASLLDRARKEKIMDSLLLKIVGEPDEKYAYEDCEVWDYQWEDYYGPTLYTSSTPLVIRDGRVIGLLRDGEIL